MSVISDYHHPHLPLLSGCRPEIKNDKFLKAGKAANNRQYIKGSHLPALPFLFPYSKIKVLPAPVEVRGGRVEEGAGGGGGVGAAEAGGAAVQGSRGLPHQGRLQPRDGCSPGQGQSDLLLYEDLRGQGDPSAWDGGGWPWREGVPGCLQADVETAEILLPQELQEETNCDQQTEKTSPGQSQAEGIKYKSQFLVETRPEGCLQLRKKGLKGFNRNFGLN